jgi:hypothetical protein
MNGYDFTALDDVLADLRQWAAQYPGRASGLLRVLRALRDWLMGGEDERP